MQPELHLKRIRLRLPGTDRTAPIAPPMGGTATRGGKKLPYGNMSQPPLARVQSGQHGLRLLRNMLWSAIRTRGLEDCWHTDSKTASPTYLPPACL